MFQSKKKKKTTIEKQFGLEHILENLGTAEQKDKNKTSRASLRSKMVGLHSIEWLNTPPFLVCNHHCFCSLSLHYHTYLMGLSNGSLEKFI